MKWPGEFTTHLFEPGAVLFGPQRDLAVANLASDNVSVLINNGDGTFEAAVSYDAGDRPNSVFAADLDGDGDLDLAVANRFSNMVSVLLNQLAVSVTLDIKPGSCPNPLNVHPYSKDRKTDKQPNGVLPVALLGSADFDVHDVDVSSLRLEGVVPLRHGYEDVSTVPSNGDDCACDDEGADGYTDLTLKFSRADIIAAVGSARGTIKLTLTGDLTGGESIEASDCIWVRSKKDGVGSPVVVEMRSVKLMPTIPNPFNPSTRIAYMLSEDRRVRLSIFNVRGERVVTLVDAWKPAGEHEVVWDAMGRPSGIYFYRLVAGDYTETRKMILLK